MFSNSVQGSECNRTVYFFVERGLKWEPALGVGHAEASGGHSAPYRRQQETTLLIDSHQKPRASGEAASWSPHKVFGAWCPSFCLLCLRCALRGAPRTVGGEGALSPAPRSLLGAVPAFLMPHQALAAPIVGMRTWPPQQALKTQRGL